VLESNKQIELHGNTRLARIVYHRYWFYGSIIAQGFLKHFSPEFLFLHGDGNLRHSTVVFGLLYPIDAFFILLALVCIFTQKEKRVLILVACVLFAGVAPSIVTPTPHALRFLFALPALTLLSAFGVAEFTKRCRFKQLRARRVGTFLFYVLFVCTYVWYYHTQYPVKAAGDWQYGYKQMYEDVAREKRSGESVYVSREQGRPSMYYLFYSSYDPEKIQEAGPTLPKDQLELLRVDDYHFVDAIPQDAGLFATSQTKVDPKGSILDTVKSLDGSIIWVIWRRT
jgi:hypothetical protein